MTSSINYFAYPTNSMPIQVSLQNLPVFESFYPNLLEQVTGSGRFFCPHPKFSFSGLEESSKYQLSLRFDRISENKFQFKNGVWVVDEFKRPSTSKKENLIFTLPDIATGSELKSEVTEFVVPITHRPDMTNSTHFRSKAVVLETCVKYQPMLIVDKIPENGQMGFTSQEFKFDCLAFIAVCRYRNSRVSAIKSELNGYGKTTDKRRISRAHNAIKRGSPSGVNSSAETYKFGGSTNPLAESVVDAQPYVVNHYSMTQAPEHPSLAEYANHSPLHQASGHLHHSNLIPPILNFQEHYPFPSNENFYYPGNQNTSYSFVPNYTPVFDHYHF